MDYEKSDVSRLPKQIYIVRVTGDSVRLYSVFHTACSRGGSDYCVLSIGGAPINPESLQVVGFSDRFAAPGTEGRLLGGRVRRSLRPVPSLEDA